MSADATPRGSGGSADGPRGGAEAPLASGAPGALRVLLLTPAFPPQLGGIQLLCSRLADGLAAGGLNVTVLAPALPPGQAARSSVAGVLRGASEQSGDATATRASGIVLRRVPALTRRLPRRARTLALDLHGAALARRLRPDVVLNMHIATAPAAWAARAPYVQIVYASELPPRPRLARLALARAARVVAISEHSRALAIAHGAAPDRVVIVHPGVDQPEPPVAVGAARAEPRILMLSRMDERYKGHAALIRALPLVRERMPGATLRLVGDGALRPELDRLAAAQGCGDALRLLGALPAALRDAELRAAAVLCLPSVVPADGGGEGFGIVLLEAGAFALPVVAGRGGGALDAVAHERTGLLVDDPTDPAQLASALVRLLGDPALARRLGAAGQALSREFTWERTAGAVRGLLLEAAAGARR